MASSSASPSTYAAPVPAAAAAARQALRERNAGDFSPACCVRVRLTSHIITDPLNWSWESTSGWTLLERNSSWNKFIEHCRGLDCDQLTTPGATLVLNVPAHGSLKNTAGKLYIREAYLDAHELVWKGAVLNRHQGMVFTNQPGNGASFVGARRGMTSA